MNTGLTNHAPPETAGFEFRIRARPKTFETQRKRRSGGRQMTGGSQRCGLAGGIAALLKVDLVNRRNAGSTVL